MRVCGVVFAIFSPRKTDLFGNCLLSDASGCHVLFEVGHGPQGVLVAHHRLYGLDRHASFRQQRGKCSAQAVWGDAFGRALGVGDLHRLAGEPGRMLATVRARGNQAFGGAVWRKVIDQPFGHRYRLGLAPFGDAGRVGCPPKPSLRRPTIAPQ